LKPSIFLPNYRFFIGITLLVIANFSFSQESNLTKQEIRELEIKFDQNYYKNYPVCLEISKKLVDSHKKSENNEDYFMHLMMYAQALKMNSLFNQSLKVYIEILKQTKDDEMKCDILHDIGLLYDEIGDFQKANNYYYQSLQLTKKQTDLAATYHAIGDNYTLLKNFDSSYFYYQKSLEILNLINDQEKISLLYFSQMEALVALNKIEEIEKTAQYFSILGNKNIDSYTLGYGYYAKGFYYDYKNHYDSSQFYFLETAKVCKELGYLSALKNVYDNIVRINVKEKNFEQAYIYELKKDDIEKKLLSEREVNMIKGHEVDYNTYKKTKELEIQQLQLNAKNDTIKLALSIIIFLIIILIGLFIFYNKIRGLNKSLHKKNQQINFLHRELNHRVKNNLQLLSSIVGLQSMQLNNEETKSKMEALKTRIVALSMMHSQLEENSELNLKEYIQNLFGFLLKSIANEKVQFINKADEINLTPEKLSLLALILNEIFTNFLKHGQSNDEPILEITTTIGHKKLNIFIKDNGINDFQFKGEGLGERIIKTLVKQLKGTIELRVEKGINYSIYIPIDN